MKTVHRFSALFLALLFCLGSLLACDSDTPAPGADGTTGKTDTPPAAVTPADPLLYVDISAPEGGDGSAEAPLRTITEAQARIREIKAAGALPEGGLTVLIAGGTYPVTDTIVFTAEDSGTESCPITYKAAEDGVLFSGGVTLSHEDFQPLTEEEKALFSDPAAGEAILKIDLSKYGITAEDLGTMNPYGFAAKESNFYESDSAELFVGGSRLTVSRYPNKTTGDSNLRTGAVENGTTFQLLAAGNFKDKALAIKERGVKWDLSTAWVFGYFCYGWCDAGLPIAGLDLDTLTVTLSKTIVYGVDSSKPFYFFNILAETDAPGEYFIDREKNVIYVYPTEDFATGEIVLSVFDGDIIYGSELSYLSFEGIEVAYTRARGIRLYGENLTLDGIKAHSIRYNGLSMTGTNMLVQNCLVYSIGGSAISVGGGDAATLTPSGNLVYNNYVHHWGEVDRTYENGIGISGCGVTVSHNLLHDAPHQAVTWNGPNHLMEYNEVYNVCQETDDCGAFYAGRRYDWYGSVIRYNYIHDVGAKQAAANGIYLDDALSGQTVYGNVISSTTGYGILVGGGRDNVIENNLIINTGKSTICYDARSRYSMTGNSSWWFYSTSLSMQAALIEMQQNQIYLDAFPGYGDIIPWSEGFTGDINDPMVSCNPANNIVRLNLSFTTKAGTTKAPEIDANVEAMSTVENNPAYKDRQFVHLPGIESGDCTLAEDSEVFDLGFQRIPLEEIGLVK